MYKYKIVMPSKRRFKRLSTRMKKEGRLGPYRKIGMEINFELSQKISQEDVKKVTLKPEPDPWTDEDRLLEWFVELVERHLLYTFFATDPNCEGTLEFDALIDADGFGLKPVKQMVEFINDLAQQEKVKWVKVTFVDVWKSEPDLDQSLRLSPTLLSTKDQLLNTDSITKTAQNTWLNFEG